MGTAYGRIGSHRLAHALGGTHTHGCCSPHGCLWLQVLTQTKHERDALRAGNTAARQQRGLVSSEDLLLDFEKRRQNIVAKKEQVQQLQVKHVALLRHAAESKRVAQGVLA